MTYMIAFLLNSNQSLTLQGFNDVFLVLGFIFRVPMPGPGPIVARPAQPIVFTEHLTDKQVVESTEIKLRVRIEEKPSAQVSNCEDIENVCMYC